MKILHAAAIVTLTALSLKPLLDAPRPSRAPVTTCQWPNPCAEAGR